MNYVNRIRAAHQQVQAVREEMAAEDDRRHAAGEPAIEDARFDQLNDSAERAGAQVRAALLGRDLPQQGTDSREASISKAQATVHRLQQQRLTEQDSGAERDSAERDRSNQLARWQAVEDPAAGFGAGRDAPGRGEDTGR